MGVSPNTRAVIRSTMSGAAAVYRVDMTDCEGDRGPATTRGVTVPRLQEDAPPLRFSPAWTTTLLESLTAGYQMVVFTAQTNAVRHFVSVDGVLLAQRVD